MYVVKTYLSGKKIVNRNKRMSNIVFEVDPIPNSELNDYIPFDPNIHDRVERGPGHFAYKPKKPGSVTLNVYSYTNYLDQ